MGTCSTLTEMTGEQRQSPSAPWTDDAFWAPTRRAVEEASALPADCYADQEFFDLESEKVFETAWVCVGTANELNAPGQVLVRKLGKRSVLLMRTEAGELHGFYNSCRHRGTELFANDCTAGATLRCPYHRWGYDRDGVLNTTPLFEEVTVKDFDPTDFSLHPVRTAQWGCLLFACADPHTVEIDEWFGDLTERVANYQLENWVTHLEVDLEMNANWKLISENYQEYYHVPWIHPELAKVSRVVDHYRFQGPGMYCGQTTTPITETSRDDWTVMPKATTLSNGEAVSGRFLAIFPNVLLSLLPNHAFVLRLEPLEPGKTREHCTWLLPPGNEKVSDEEFAATRDFWIDINNEDIDIVERNQRGISQGAYTPGRLSPRFEEPLHRFYNMLADHMTGTRRIPKGDESDKIPSYGEGTNPDPWTKEARKS
ncbi:MAG TPA: aromatic ring-hydroxylating dioxygenase subunit alpha [Acidimicrobiia bacterium]|nr:aromatic ring-hydroxylating dioxygenase subunit alpha [Acidimicrobiia bacterium]HIL47166.1 aromatic ring-hydroxylating dioxygenase subunit alpha [Acidimicrobiia bacterium]